LLGIATSRIWIGQGDKFKPECPCGFGACSLNILTVMRRCAGPGEDWVRGLRSSSAIVGAHPLMKGRFSPRP
jgi:hypothetical protein